MIFNAVDLGAILFVLLHMVLSWRRGLSAELGRVVGAALAFWLGLRYHPAVAEWISAHTRITGQAADVVGAIALVLVVILASMILTLVVMNIIRLAIPEGVDKVGGGIAGLVKGTLYAVIIFLIMNLWPHDYLNRQFGEASAIGSVVMQWVPSVQERMEEQGITERLREQVDASREKVGELLENKETQKKAGRIKQWFTRKE